MDNNLPVKIEKGNVLKRFVNFIKRIFGKKEVIEEQYIEKPEVIAKDCIREQYKFENIVEIPKEIRQQEKMEEIIQIIEKEPKLLNNLSINKLEIIDEYYIKQINIYKNKIANAS